VNDAPEAVDDTANTVEDTSVEIDVVANDTDPDTSDVITVTSVGDASNGMVSIDDDTGNILYTPDANFNGEDSFDYTISDGNGGTSTARVTVNVGGTNDDPTVGDSVSARATEDDASFEVDLLEGADDTDGDDLSVVNLVVTGDASGITEGEESTTLSVDPSLYDGLGDGESAIVNYTYTIEDGESGAVAQTATITITGCKR